MQVAHYAGLSNGILMNNFGLTNGGQISGVPQNEANVGIGFNNNYSQWSARMAGYFVGQPNPFNRPSYWYVNFNMAKTVSNVTFNLGINNLFNQNASQFGLIGQGVTLAQNGFAPPGQTGLTQGSEEFALPYRQVWMTATFHK